KEGLDSVVVASCAPTVHQTILSDSLSKAGLLPNQLEFADFRSIEWRNGDEGTKIAIQLVKEAIDRLRERPPIDPIKISVVKKALVVGGGVSGMQAALDIANGGYEVYLVERTSSVGGNMIRYSEVFPTLDCPQCILTPKMVEVAQHPNIKLLAFTEVESCSGYPGNFKVKLRRKATYVDWDKCTGCGECAEACPVSFDGIFERGMAKQKAIYMPFAQAVPSKYVRDTDHCLRTTKGVDCRRCEKACQAEAIVNDMEDRFEEIEVGAIVLATGFDLLSKAAIQEYEEDPDIIDPIQFERILCPSGPSSGVPFRPSDGKAPKEVVFIQCVGSRDPEQNKPYCSRVCCMYTAKLALLYKHADHDGQAYIFYMDIRSDGKGYEEFVQRAQEEAGVYYIRGRVSKIFREGDKIMVWGADTLSNKRIEIAADLVVLALAMVPRADSAEVAEKFGINVSELGFFNENHPKLSPLETPVQGIFVTGPAQAPKDIPESCGQASAAAGKVLSILARDELIYYPKEVVST
ncbi:MAG: CoB--CoM heterodisulfide reductase iron-sulfur subunit A family protein, partial [Thermodesulfobacteriota bacterium]|nr:CoB--CoM heterodisulfide reductase iron-sulfur subunit A family protein [Thermodesulfobacteriota bacterium]